MSRCRRILVLLLSLCSIPAWAQQLRTLHEGKEQDSSIYHALRISSNEIWLAGEYGILKRIDSAGNMNSIVYPNQGDNILHMLLRNRTIYLGTENGRIYTYNRDSNTWACRQFKHFRHRAFYGMEILENGEIVLCGGGRRVSRGGMGIPRGFIARTDTTLSTIKKEWRSPFKFVWDIEHYKDAVYAVAYNGFSSRMWVSPTTGEWEKHEKQPMLVHDLYEADSAMWLCGMRNINLNKNGRAVAQGQTIQKFSNSGALWGMSRSPEGSILAVSHAGTLEIVKTGTKSVQTSALRVGRPLYTLAWFNESSAVVAGHAHSVYLLHWPK